MPVGHVTLLSCQQQHAVHPTPNLPSPGLHWAVVMVLPLTQPGTARHCPGEDRLAHTWLVELAPFVAGRAEATGRGGGVHVTIWCPPRHSEGQGAGTGGVQHLNWQPCKQPGYCHVQPHPIELLHPQACPGSPGHSRKLIHFWSVAVEQGCMRAVPSPTSRHLPWLLRKATRPVWSNAQRWNQEPVIMGSPPATWRITSDGQGLMRGSTSCPAAAVLVV
jgi:hypothetical protein